jgi:hypothetical protein
LGDLIQVAGCPGTHTAVNGITNGPGASFVLASVSNLFIVDGNGSNIILLGLVRSVTGVISPGNGFVIPGGNITFDVGSGTDNIQLMNITATVGQINVNGAHGAAVPPAINGGTDTVNYTNVLAGASQILPGNGPLTVNQTNVTLGFDFIYGSGGVGGTGELASTPVPLPALFGATFPAFLGGARPQSSGDNIRITNSRFAPAPRIFAIGNLQILDGNRSNTFFIDNTSVGPAGIFSGIVQHAGDIHNRTNNLTFSHSTILQADVILGSEAGPLNAPIGRVSGLNQWNANITMDTDIITGQHLLTQALNSEGLSGFVNTPGATAPGSIDSNLNNLSTRDQVHITHQTMTNLLFTTAFPVFTTQFGMRIDDGDYYRNTVDTGGGTGPRDGNTLVVTQVDLPGIMSVNLGDHMHTVQLGNIGGVDANGTPTATDVGDVDAGQLTLSAENDLDVVVVAADVTGQFLPVIGLPVPTVLPAFEFIQLGDNTINNISTGTIFPPSFGTGNISPPSVFTSGQVGTAAIDGNMDLLIGNNLNPSGDALGWPVKMIETVIGHLAPTFLTGNLLVFSAISTPAPLGGATPFTAPATLPKLEVGQNTFVGTGTPVVSPNNTDNGLSLFIDPTVVQGDLRIFMGSGGFFNRESLVLNGVTAGNVFIQLDSFSNGAGVGDIPDGNPNLGAYIAIDHTAVTDTIFGDVFDGTMPGLTLTDIGTGADFLSLGLIPGATPGFGFVGGQGPVAGDFLTISDTMSILLAANGIGANTAEAHNTTCAFGTLDGNAGGGGTYTDDGGNIGFFVVNLVG